jgi:hypothetical protein
MCSHIIVKLLRDLNEPFATTGCPFFNARLCDALLDFVALPTAMAQTGG